jgi:hypothetical protein
MSRHGVTPAPPPVMVRTRIAQGTVRGALERAERLTPYVVETIAEDAVRAGPGARLDVALPRCVDARTLAAVRAVFRLLRGRGIAVRVRRGAPPDRGWRGTSTRRRPPWFVPHSEGART